VKQAVRQHSFFELAIIALLLVTANWSAVAFSAAGFVAWLHTAFLLSAYLLVRLLVGRMNVWVGKLVFSTVALLLLGDITVQQLTGVHLNLFMLSLLFEPSFAAEVGISGPWASVLLLAFLAVTLFASRLLETPSFKLKGRSLLIVAALSGAGAQALYGLLFFNGTAEVEEVRRNLAFFTAPHPYHREKVLGIFLDKTSQNPFAIAASVQKSTPLVNTDIQIPKHGKNILMIVTDSLRSKDIAATPSLTPNLVRWGKQGFLTYDHFSTSNCTHFSFYSMFTGKLPTRFGAARRGNKNAGFLQGLAAGGYQLSTAEASSLNWYDVADIIFPPAVDRYIATDGDPALRDKAVSAHTIKKLQAAVQTGKPFFHLTYYFGTHYPYKAHDNDDGQSSLDSYALAIRSFDDELGQLMNWVEGSGLLDNTIIIITSDHGEEFSDTGAIGHATKLTDEQMKVPFVLIDKTSTRSSAGLVKGSHLNIAPYLTGSINKDAPTAQKPILLTNCGYDHPSGFAVLTSNWRADFVYRDGYLTPTASPDGTLPTPDIQSKAAAALLSQIKTEVN